MPPEVEAVCLLGWRVYPASRRSKAAMFKGATDLASCDLDTVERWSRDYGTCNWRVVMEGSGIWALDIDVPSQDHAGDGVRAMAELVAVHGPLPKHPATRSGGGGSACFFRFDGDRIIGKTGCPAPGIDPRRGRLSVTIPPSIHLTTREPYRWLTPPWEQTPPAAPSWLMRLVREPEPQQPGPRVASPDTAWRAVMRACDAVAQAAIGTRNDTLNKRAYQIGILMAGGLVDESAIRALAGAGAASGLSEAEVRATIKSGVRKGMQHG